MRKTKFLALLLAVAMVVSMVVVPAYAAEAPFTMKLADASGNTAITAEPGQTIDLYLSIANNPGVVALGARVAYEDGWTLSAVDKRCDYTLMMAAESVSTDGFSATTTANPYVCCWVMASGTPEGKLVDVDGRLAKLTFVAPEKAGTYDFTLDITSDEIAKAFNLSADTNDDGTINKHGNTIRLYQDMEVVNCSVTVSGGEEPAASACPEHGDVSWTEVAADAWAAGGALATGHYKLTGDQNTTAALTVAEGETVCIDLNGNNITAGAKAAASTVSYRVFENAGTLAIVDTTAAGEGDAYTAGIISGGAMKEQGNGGNNTDAGASGGNVYNSGTFTLVDGIIADGYLTGGAYDSADKGGNICSVGGTLNIKGGWIKDGSIKRTSQNGSTSSRRGGGNIAALNTDVNITGGMITGGYVYGTYNYTSSTARSSYLYGGNLMISGGSLDIANATIADGVINYTLNCTVATALSYVYGGNIYVEKVGDISIVNSSITGGQAKTYATGNGKSDVVAQGGNIYMNLSAATNKLTIDANSVISGGVTDATSAKNASATAETTVSLNYRGGNIYLNRGTLDIYGKVTNGSGQRGSIFTPGNATINVYEGAELSGSTSVDQYGHEVTLTSKSAVLNVYGGKISSALEKGSTVYALYADVNIYDGLIENTTGELAISTYYSSNGNVVITMEGGTVKGEVRLDDNCQWNVTGGVIDTTISDNGTLSIGAGVISYNNPEAYLTGCVAYTKTADYYVTYADLSDALAAAVTGDTIILVAEATADAVTLNGIALDLNGNTLTAASLDASNVGNVIDNTDGKGKLVTTDALFHANNTMVPVTVEGGYVFESTGLKEGYYTDSAFQAGNATAKYYVYIDKAAADTALDEALAAGTVKLVLNVKWTNADSTTGEKAFELSGEKLAAYVEGFDTKMLLLNLSGLENVTELECNAQLVSNSATVE